MRQIQKVSNNKKQRTRGHVPDGGWGWVVTFSSFMIQLLVDGLNFTFGIFFPEFLRYFGKSKWKTQLLHSILVGTLLTLGPVASALVNKFGSRRVAGSGAVIASIGFFLSSFSPNLDVMIILYSIVGGFGLSLLYLPSIVIIGIYFDKRRALATGIALCGAAVGGFVFAPLSEFLLETYGWRGTMWIISAIMFNGVVFSAFYRTLETENDQTVMEISKENNEKVPAQTADSCFEQSCLSIKAMFDFTLLKSPTMLMYGASSLFVMFGYFIPSNFLPVWASDVNLSTDDGVLLILLMGVSNTVMRIVIGYITDKAWANSLIIYNTSLLIGAVSTFFVPFYSSFTALAIYAIVFGTIMAVFGCLRSILMAELLGVHRLSSSFGLVGLSMGLSAFVGSPIAGALSDMSGNYEMTLYFGGITLGLGGLICIPLRRISEWEKKKIIDFNITTTYDVDQKEDRKRVELLSTKSTLPIYTISGN